MRSLARVMPIAIISLGAGCTFLIDFDEVDAVASDDASAREEAALAFPPPCDPAFPLTEVRCNPAGPSVGCATKTDAFPTYPAGQPREGALVTCTGGATPLCVQRCPFGCVALPDGFPDACDDCEGRADGTYCMKDLRGTDGRNNGLAIDCRGGRTVEAYVCGVGRCATECPRTEHAPSCCI